MKILFHLNSMGRGGAERVVSTLANAFSKDGHEIVVATEWYSEREYPLESRVKRKMIGIEEDEEQKNRISKIILRHTRLRKCILQEKPDVVVSFCVKANFRAAISLIGTKIPLIVSVRNDPQIDYKPHKLVTRIMEKRAVGCVFQTPDARGFFDEKFQEKSTIIYNPLTSDFLEEANALYENLPKDEQGSILRKKEIVSVGRITEQKNHLLLVRAFAKLAGDFPEYILKIFGEKENQNVYDDIEKLIREKHLEERVLLMGASCEIQKEIVDAALFVLASDFEGMPNALIEAMVLGLPCVATDCPCGGSKMLIESKEVGILVPVREEDAMEQAMRFLLSNPKEAERMGARARTISDKVKEERIVLAWYEYINRVIK